MPRKTNRLASIVGIDMPRLTTAAATRLATPVAAARICSCCSGVICACGPSTLRNLVLSASLSLLDRARLLEVLRHLLELVGRHPTGEPERDQDRQEKHRQRRQRCQARAPAHPAKEPIVQRLENDDGQQREGDDGQVGLHQPEREHHDDREEPVEGDPVLGAYGGRSTYDLRSRAARARGAPPCDERPWRTACRAFRRGWVQALVLPTLAWPAGRSRPPDRSPQRPPARSWPGHILRSR